MKSPKEQFLKVYSDYSDAIYRHCYFRLSNKELAENLMQETFMRAWKYLLKGEKVDNMRALLYRIAGNLVIDTYRKKKETSLENMTDAGFQVEGDGEDTLTHKVEIKKLLERLEDIDGKYRELIVMRFIDDMRPKEIADLLGLKTNVVSVRIHRGLEKLRNLYEN